MKLLIIIFAAISCLCACSEASETGHNDVQVDNIIYMIGDGMGLAHVSMVQIEGNYKPTIFDRADNVALIKTYSNNNRVTDSAAAGTALATGEKTDNAMIGLKPDGTPVKSIISKASEQDFATGIVVTAMLQHATPAAFYAHTDHRENMDEIAYDFMRSNIDVAFGGGHKDFMDTYGKTGENYMDVMRSHGYEVLRDERELNKNLSGKVVGVFADVYMPPSLEGRGNFLPNATQKALDILTANVERNNQKGFVLMVEGSQIDTQSHRGNIDGILAETIDFANAVEVAVKYADTHPNTLVVVCADHETGGLTIASNQADFTMAESGLSYKTASTSHTAIMTPVFLYGEGAECINGILENNELSLVLQTLLKVK